MHVAHTHTQCSVGVLLGALLSSSGASAAPRGLAAAGGHAADVGPSLNNGVELGVIATSGGHDGVPIAIGRPIAAADPWADPPPP